MGHKALDIFRVFSGGTINDVAGVRSCVAEMLFRAEIKFAERVIGLEKCAL